MTTPTPPPQPVDPAVPPVILPPPAPSNQFFCDSDGNRYDGVISVYGINLPPGWATVWRVQQDQSLFVIRGGAWVRTDHDFVLADTEAPFDVPVSYIMRLVPDVRALFHNYFVNPNFENPTTTFSYLTKGGSRTLTGITRPEPLPPFGSKTLLVSGLVGGPPSGNAVFARRNLFIQPSFEGEPVDAASVDFSSTAATLMVRSAIDPPPSGGSKVLEAANFTKTGLITLKTVSLRPVATVGKAHRVSAYVRATNAVIGTTNVRIDAEYRNAAGSIPGTLTSGAAVTPTGAWQRMDVSLGPAPAGATAVGFYFNAYQLTPGLSLQIDAIMAEIVTSVTAPTRPFFDGNTAPTGGSLVYAWEGTVNKSTSTESVLHIEASTDQRLLTYTKPAAELAFAPDTAYKVTGRVNIIPPIFSWAEARSNPAQPATPIGGMTAPPARTWDDPMFDSGGHTWQEVLGYASGSIATNGTLYVGFVDANGTPIAGTTPQKAVTLDSTGTTDFVEFDIDLMTPAAAMTNAHIGFFQGFGTLTSIDPVTGAEVITSDIDEFRRLWLFDGLMIDKVSTNAANLPYFDGSNPLTDPDDPKIFGIGYTQLPFHPYTFGWDSGDAETKWLGTPDASASEFLGASEIGAYTGGCVLVSPEYLNGHMICEPVFLSDPIIPAYSEWLGLLSIGPLSWSPRRELLDILGRHAPIALSQYRSTPSTDFHFITHTLEERTQFITIINSGRIMLLRNPDPRYPENMWYISIGDVTEERIYPDHRYPVRRWVVSAQVVDRPSGLLVALKGQSWQNVRTDYSTWDAVDTQNDAWLNVLIGPAALAYKSMPPYGEPGGTVVPVSGPSWFPVQ